MHVSPRIFARSAVILWSGISASVMAATTVEFSVTQTNAAPQTQTVYVKDGSLMIKGAGGDVTTDILYTSNNSSMTIIDHSKRTFMTMDEQRIGQMAEQAQGMMTVLQQQLGSQLANLPPEQAERLRAMMGGMEGQQQPAPQPSKLVERGSKSVNGFDCTQYDVMKGEAKVAEVCVSPASELDIPEEDFAVVTSLQEFGARLVEKASGLLERFGAQMPQFGSDELAGVPIEMRDLSSDGQSVMTVTKVASGTGDVMLGVPEGYEAQQLPNLGEMPAMPGMPR